MPEQIQLMPGVRLTAEYSDKFKNGCFSINFLRPLCRQEAAKNAVTFSVLLRGTEKNPDMQALSARMDELYGAEIGFLVRKKGEVQCVGLYADFVEDELLEGEPVFEGVARLAAEMLLQPKLENGVFCRGFVEREKENVIHSIRSRINSKRSYAVSRMVETMFRGEAYGVDRLGEEEDVTPITAQSLYEHYKTILATSQVEICYMGRKTAEEAAAVFRSVLNQLPAVTPTEVSTEFIPKSETVKETAESLNVTQGKLCMGLRLGCRAGDEVWPAMVLLNSVFGSGVTSKLFVNVREKMSLCYYASSTLEKFKGIMVISSGIEFDKYETAKAAILEQLDACRKGEISEEELQSARKGLISSLKMGMDSPAHMDEYYLGQAITNSKGTIPAFMEKLETVTAAELASCAQMITLDTVYFLKGAEEK